MGLIGWISDWLGRRRAFAQLCREDAIKLLAANPDTAYYDAHRIAARARFAGDGQAFMRWARVANEIARISDNPMDMSVVERIVEEERRRADGTIGGRTPGTNYPERHIGRNAFPEG